MTVLRPIVTAFLATLGFAILLRAPRKAVLPAALVGTAAYLVYFVLQETFAVSEPLATFIGALLGTLLGQLLARRLHMIATIFILLSIVPAVPGMGLYRFMEMLGSSQTALGMEVGVSAMLSIAMIALGIMLGSFSFRVCASAMRRLRKDTGE